MLYFITLPNFIVWLALFREILGNIWEVVSCYCPQAGRSVDEKEEFYELMNNFVTGKMVLVGGDFNRHVGSDMSDSGEVHGGFGIMQINDGGIRLLDLVGVSCLKDEVGAVKVSVHDRKKIWKEHMEKLMNVENEWSDSIDAGKVEGAVRRTQVKKVRCAVNRMKTGRASGPSRVAIELFKADGDKCSKSLTNLFNICSRISYRKNGC